MNCKELLVFCFLRCSTSQTRCRLLYKDSIYYPCKYCPYTYKDNTYIEKKQVYTKKYKKLFNDKSIDSIVEEIGV